MPDGIERGAARAAALPQRCEAVFTGGRVIDPESGLDAVCNVGIVGGAIAYVGEALPDAACTIDVSNHVLAPGIIDLHSHAQTLTGLRLQALDGVTTALDLEGGGARIDELLAIHGEQGRPINYGYSVGWTVLRRDVMNRADRSDKIGARPELAIESSLLGGGGGRAALPADRNETDLLLDVIDAELDRGAIGIGVPIGYIPDAERAEYFRIAQLAARRDVPVFTHARYASVVEPGTSLDAALEIIAAAAGTGAAMHHCHVNSTSLAQIDVIANAIERARQLGNRVTTEAYPYGAGCTTIGATFLDPSRLDRMGIEPTSLRYLPTGERVADARRLAELRDRDPGGLCVVEFIREDEPAGLDQLLRSITLADTAIASDATPIVLGDGYVTDDWPIPPGATGHPRCAGCYGRTLGWLVRELGVLDLREAIRRCTLLPAQIVGAAAPALARKARVQVGADADLIVFDPDTVRDRASYTDLTASTGFEFVMVDGTLVVDHGELQVGVTPGKAIRGEAR